MLGNSGSWESYSIFTTEMEIIIRAMAENILFLVQVVFKVAIQNTTLKTL